MAKHRRNPSWKWSEGTVNTDDEHFEITYGEDPKPVALVGRGRGRSFRVQFLLPAGHNIPDTYEYRIVSGPHAAKAVEGVLDANSVTVAPNDWPGFTVYFSVPVKEVDPRNAFWHVAPAVFFFGDIGPMWALTRERVAGVGGLVIVSSYCYGGKICDY